MHQDHEAKLRALGRRRARLKRRQTALRVEIESVLREVAAAGDFSATQASRLLGASKRAVYKWLDPPVA